MENAHNGGNFTFAQVLQNVAKMKKEEKSQGETQKIERIRNICI